jgi:hypothetical protein
MMHRLTKWSRLEPYFCSESDVVPPHYPYDSGARDQVPNTPNGRYRRGSAESIELTEQDNNRES